MANEIKSFFTIQNNVQAEIVEKKSKFIANLFYIESIEEAEEIIKKLKRDILMHDIIVSHIG